MPDSTSALYGLAGGALAAAGIVSTLVALAIYVLQIIGWWKIFTKAGEAGWKSLIPLYNLYILYNISCTKSAGKASISGTSSSRSSRPAL